ncbi:uncharacterized protein CLUP02_05902 [Colletotrichum lupini]|uniref:Uncharacterized protein n=1 Tax=Colletotrichum lupini TaxID=145971 RepID=A0A9Q8SN27_9PEZI|nr:uncharacterized protein CLUP02_05902 [Colletotrichum lupini]UQC80419.1 hypothetical protein CLUP02_05902 [Colletotrichum lupini]
MLNRILRVPKEFLYCNHQTRTSDRWGRFSNSYTRVLAVMTYDTVIQQLRQSDCHFQITATTTSCPSTVCECRSPLSSQAPSTRRTGLTVTQSLYWANYQLSSQCRWMMSYGSLFPGYGTQLRHEVTMKKDTISLLEVLVGCLRLGLSRILRQAASERLLDVVRVQRSPSSPETTMQTTPHCIAWSLMATGFCELSLVLIANARQTMPLPALGYKFPQMQYKPQTLPPAISSEKPSPPLIDGNK